MTRKASRILWFSEVDKNDVGLVGGFGESLGGMVRAGLPVANGFVVSSAAYFSFIRENNLAHRIEHLLSTAHFERADSLMQVSAHIKRLILDGGMPEDFVKEIFFGYRKISGLFGKANLVVRSTMRGGETYFNVKGEANLLLKIKEAWASFFEPGVMFNRHKRHLDHLRTGMAIVVQRMVKPEQSGVMFTMDPDTSDKSIIVVGGNKVKKHSLEIIKRDNIGNKMLTNKQIIDLAILGKRLEQHYYFPQVIEWAIERQKIFIIKRQPFTGISSKENGAGMRLDIPPTHRLELLLKGDPVFPGIATGRVRLVRSVKEINSVMQGDVLVVSETSSDYLPAMKKAAVIITDLGGRGSHAAIWARQLGKPTVIGTKNATKVLKHGMIVTVNGKRGEVNRGRIMRYES
jgi:pyruvate,water dikinase